VQVIANGNPVEVTDSATVADVLEVLGLAGRVVVVERNGEPVDRSLVASQRVESGDRLEVVRAVAGG